jgi:hypothetical protein
VEPEGLLLYLQRGLYPVVIIIIIIISSSSSSSSSIVTVVVVPSTCDLWWNGRVQSRLQNFGREISWKAATWKTKEEMGGLRSRREADVLVVMRMQLSHDRLNWWALFEECCIFGWDRGLPVGVMARLRSE